VGGQFTSRVSGLWTDGFWPFSQIDIDDTLFEELPPVQTELMPPHRHSRSPALQLRGSAQEALGAEAWIPQSGQQELNYHAAGKCKPFLDPGKARVFFLLFLPA
jgi:hypothetical protein